MAQTRNQEGHYKKKTRELHRVVVTGIGAVTPLGNNLEESWKKLIHGESGIQRVTRFDARQLKTQIAGEVKGFNATEYVEQKDLKKIDLFIQYSIAAATMALHKASLKSLSDWREKAGVILGTSMGGMPGVERQHSKLLEKGPGRVSPFFIPSVLANMAGAQIAMRFGIRGPQFTVKSACATGTHSIGEAYRYIQDGICEIMLAGGTEANISPLTFAGFESLSNLSQCNDRPEKASRPWDQNRDGFVISEGACVFVLESLDHALDRGAPILAEINGYSATSDAYHVTSPLKNGEGLAQAIKTVLQQAQLQPSSIDCINAHAASTLVGDVRELQAVKEVFSRTDRRVAISSNKANIGHCLGAAGAIESAFAILSILNNQIPPQLNLEKPIEGLENFVWNRDSLVNQEVNHVLKTSMGFGGANAALLFSRFNL